MDKANAEPQTLSRSEQSRPFRWSAQVWSVVLTGIIVLDCPVGIMVDGAGVVGTKGCCWVVIGASVVGAPVAGAPVVAGEVLARSTLFLKVKAPTFWQSFLIVQTQDAVSIWIHNGVAHPSYLFDDYPDLPSVSGKHPVSDITKDFRNQKQGEKSQNEIGEFQVRVEHTEDRIGFDVGAFFREENGGRHVRGHPVSLAQFLGQVRLDWCESKMI